MSMRTLHALLILQEVTGRPGIAKVKCLRLRSVKVVAEGGGIVFDRITREDMRVVDR